MLLLTLGNHHGRGQLWALSYPEKEARRITNDLTRDGETLAAIEGTVISNLWVALGMERSRAQQITSFNLPIFSVTGAPQRRTSGKQRRRLWAFTADGKQRGPFTDLEHVDTTTACGRSVVLTSSGSGTAEIVRFDADGSNPTELANGDLALPVYSPNGKYVFYVELGTPQKIWCVSVDGGTPVEIAKVLGENLAGRMSISFAGKMVAYPYEEFTPTPKMKLAIIPTECGASLREKDAPGGYEDGSPLWSSDDKGLDYILTRDGSSNIWEHRYTVARHAN